MDAQPKEGPEPGRHVERFWSRKAPLPRVHVVALESEGAAWAAGVWALGGAMSSKLSARLFLVA